MREHTKNKVIINFRNRDSLVGSVADSIGSQSPVVLKIKNSDEPTRLFLRTPCCI